MGSIEEMIDFNTDNLNYMGMTVPDHTQDSLVRYFINGWEPGGFLTSMLTGDLYRAITVADTANRQMLWAIGRWIMDNAPQGSWGSAESVHNWCTDVNGIRTRWTTEVEKKHMWKVLSK